MPVVRICAICQQTKQKIDPKTMEPYTDVIRYSLYRRRPVPNSPNGKTTQFGMGGIDICGDCWTKYAKPNHRAKKDR